MKIKTLCRRAYQAANELIVLKSLLISVAVLCACLASVRNAEALGVQLQGGFGDDSGGSEFGLSYRRIDLNIFLYDSEMFDLFIGGEQASSKHRPGNAEVVSSYAYNAAVLGIRIKPSERSRRVYPYLIVGVLGGAARYSAYANDSYVIVSQSRDDASFARGRAGLGLNFAVKKIAIEVEVNCTGGVPAAYATVTDSSGPVGNRSRMSMFDGNLIINLALGLHYEF